MVAVMALQMVRRTTRARVTHGLRWAGVIWLTCRRRGRHVMMIHVRQRGSPTSTRTTGRRPHSLQLSPPYLLTLGQGHKDGFARHNLSIEFHNGS